jgi:hypothetical protein
MATLTLLSSVDRLSAWDNTNNQKIRAFGLNLSVALDGAVDAAWLRPPSDPSKPDMRMILWPWRWSIPSIRVYKLDANRNILKDTTTGNPVPFVDVAPMATDTGLADKIADIRKNLEDVQFGLSVVQDSQANFQWQTQSKLSHDLKPWHTLIGKVSTYPYPVPQGLKLSFIFFVDFSRDQATFGADAAYIFAAPNISRGAPFPGVDTAPGEPISDPNQDPRVRKAVYNAVPELPVQAYSFACSLAPESGDSIKFIDPATQWVGDAGQQNNFDEDWLSTFEARMADAFDLSNLLLAFMKDPSQKALLDGNDGANVVTCAQMALAAMADLTGPGAVAGPDGMALINKLLAAAGKMLLTDGDLKTLVSTAVYASLEEQRSTLRQVITDGSYSLLQPVPEKIALAQAISELEAIRGRIADLPTLLALAKAQWKKLLPGRATDIDPMGAAADVNASLPAGQEDRRVRDLRRQMALSNLGRFWKDFLNCDSSKSTHGREMITAGVPAFLSYYLAKRFNLTVPAWPPGLNPAKEALNFSPAIDGKIFETALFTFLTTTYGTTVQMLTPPLPAEAADPLDAPPANPTPPAVTQQPNETPHAVTLQIDQLTGIDSVDPMNDVLNRFSGVAFLMRESSTPTWRCLNQADLVPTDGGGQPNSNPIALDFLPPAASITATIFGRFA